MQRNEGQAAPSLGLKVGGAFAAGAMDVLLFHPGDTLTRRLQIREGKILLPGRSFAQIAQEFKQAIFGLLANQSLGAKMASLYNGIGFAALYKVSQTTIRFGGQAATKDFLKQHLGQYPDALLHGLAGGMVGALESFVLAPIESLKVKYQVNKNYFHSKGLFQVFRQEGFNLYNGTLVTLFRNVPASFIMFSFSALVKEKFLGVENPALATFSQNAIGASAAAVVTVIATNPLDVIKTRVQRLPGNASTAAIFNALRGNEGWTAFFKGVGTKLLLVAPKTTTTMTLALTIPVWTSNFFKPITSALSPEKEQDEAFSPKLK